VGKPKKILVVDDEIATLTLVRRVLLPEGYEVLTTTDGKEALRLYEEAKPDLILLDVIIPEIDGLTVLRQIRKTDPFVGIIVISALTSEKIARDAILSGANDYMTKPFTFHDLRERIKEVLHTTALHKENARLQEELDRANAKLRMLFERYMAPPVAARLISSPGLPDLGGTRKTISVVFMDLRNFTHLAERLEAHLLMNTLNRYLSAAAEAISDYGGTVDKFIGDAVMAFFNAPLEQPGHQQQAVQAAWTMKQKLVATSRELGELALDFGIGIHTGEAIVGNVGSHQLMNYTAIGDVVNVADRLQEAARQGQILISETTASALNGTVELIPHGRWQLRGHSERISVFEVIGIKETTVKEDKI